jgi:hypothetical protein
MVLEALFTETTSNCHEKKRFSILSLNIYFGEGFPQNSSLRIRWSIKHLFNLTHSDYMSRSTLNFVIHFLVYP